MGLRETLRGGPRKLVAPAEVDQRICPVDVPLGFAAQVGHVVRGVLGAPVDGWPANRVIEVPADPVLLIPPDVDLAAPAHVLVFNLGVVRIPLPAGHRAIVGPVLRLAVEVLEVVQRQHIEVAPRLVIVQRSEVETGVRPSKCPAR